MTDHSDSSHEHGHLSVPVSSISASVLRLAAATAKGAGYTKTAEATTGWPELVGGKIGAALKSCETPKAQDSPSHLPPKRNLRMQ